MPMLSIFVRCTSNVSKCTGLMLMCSGAAVVVWQTLVKTTCLCVRHAEVLHAHDHRAFSGVRSPDPVCARHALACAAFAAKDAPQLYMEQLAGLVAANVELFKTTGVLSAMTSHHVGAQIAMVMQHIVQVESHDFVVHLVTFRVQVQHHITIRACSTCTCCREPGWC